MWHSLHNEDSRNYFKISCCLPRDGSCRIQLHLLMECGLKSTPITHTTSWTKIRKLNTPLNLRLVTDSKKSKHWFFELQKHFVGSYSGSFSNRHLGIAFAVPSGIQHLESRFQRCGLCFVLITTLDNLRNSAFQSSQLLLLRKFCSNEKRLSSDTHFERQSHQEKKLYHS